LSLALLLAGCAGTPIRPPAVTDSPLVEQDGPLRTVRMNAGRALTYVQPETAAQILCQTVDRHRLERLLDDDQVSLRPERPPEAACAIGGTRVGLRMSLLTADVPFTGTTTIAGRPAAALPDNAGEVGMRVALTDDVPSLRPGSPARPLLDVVVVYGTNLDPESRRELAIRILVEAVPLLTLAGDPLPEIDPTGRIAYTGSPLIRGGQIVDLPQPLQALQLCTLLRDQTPPPTRLDPTDTARCTADSPAGPVTVALQPTSKPPTDYPETIAGRPARRTPTTLLIRLRDEAQLDLSLTTPTPTPLAERLVPLLIS
jgi:hypothetical protein